ncbi:hypothetical protein [Streptomyces flavidovirens]|uniref:Transposase n=1 Tax=Streptomyces flavidovirens TaxID=67298 RepID=A0ABW6RK96_9ACTN
MRETAATGLGPGSAPRPDQKNVLLKVVLRLLHRTLTDYDANLLRDRDCAAVHRGSTSQWAATG